MGNLTSLGDLFIRLLVFGLPVSLFYFLLINRKSRVRFSIFLVLFILSGIGAVYFYTSLKSTSDLAAKDYFGYYQLEMLDREDCNNCKVLLHSNRRYDIIQNGEIIGKGKWNVKFDSESGSSYLHVENGPNHMIWPSSRTITYINRIEQ